MTSDFVQPLQANRPSKRAELLTFLALAFGVWPIVAVGVVGGYGFLIWMWQLALEERS